MLVFKKFPFIGCTVFSGLLQVTLQKCLASFLSLGWKRQVVNLSVLAGGRGIDKGKLLDVRDTAAVVSLPML